MVFEPVLKTAWNETRMLACALRPLGIAERPLFHLGFQPERTLFVIRAKREHKTEPTPSDVMPLFGTDRVQRFANKSARTNGIAGRLRVRRTLNLAASQVQKSKEQKL